MEGIPEYQTATHDAHQKPLRRLAAGCWLVLLPFAPVQAMDLQTAYRLTLQNDANFLAAQAGAEAAREALPLAWAGLLPQISASMGRSENDVRQDSINSFTGQPQTRNYDYRAETLSLNLRQPVFRLGNLVHYWQAGAQVAHAEATLEKDTQDVALRLASAYFEVLSQREGRNALVAQREAYAGQLAAAERSLKSGFGTRTDIDEARARLELVLAQEIEVQHNLDVAERTLGGMLRQHIKASELAGIDAQRLALELPQPGTLDAWLTLAEERNPELKALRANIEMAQHEVDKGRAAHLPTLDLVASRSNNNNESITTVGSEYWTTSIGLQFNLPIYAGGQVSSAIRQSRARLEEARQQYEAGKRQLEVSIAREFGAVSQGIARVRALEQALQAADQALVSTRKGVQAGVRNNIDILNAVQQLANARLELGIARMRYALARLKLEAAAGNLDDKDIEQVNHWLSPSA